LVSRPESVYEDEACQALVVPPVPPFVAQETLLKRYSTGRVESEPVVAVMATEEIPVSFGGEANVMGSGVGGEVSPPPPPALVVPLPAAERAVSSPSKFRTLTLNV
jgi:hypothetical protein